MQRPQRDTVTLKDIVITEELSRRNPRSANLLKENQALHALARQLVNQPQTMLQTLVDIALDLCNAVTAGVSLIETTPTGEEVFRWNVLAGALARYVGGTNPRNFSPCGVCLDRGSPQLYSHPERYFTDLQAANTPIVEGLVLPLIADNHALGTIWIMSHDEQRHFDSEDVRIMTSLADFTATVLLLKQRQKGELLAANAALEAEIAERRQAEERSHALISNLPSGAAFVVDRNLRYLLAEGEALAIAGFKPEDFVGHTIFEVLPPELAANYESMYRAALAGEAFEHEHHAHDRTYISRGTPLRAENGEIYAVLAVSYDITDRKLAEAALRKSEEQFRLFVTASSDIVYRMSADWHEMLSLTGKNFLLDTDNPRTTWIETYIPPEEQPRVWAAIQNAIRTKSTFELEHQVIQHDGAIGWTFSRAIPMLNEQGDIVEWFGSASNVTERKRSEEALRESEERFRTLANTAPALIWYNDAQGNNRFINQYFLDFTGRSAEQIRGEGWHDLIHPDDAEFYIADYLAAAREQCSWHNRNRIRRHDGVWRWHDNYAQPLFNANGVYLGHVGVTIDNTDAIEAEVALRESEAKYRSLFETMDEGLSVLELIYDDSGKPVDMRWLEANPAFEKITGLKNVAGRLTSEFVPSEDYWLETYDRVVKTGKPIRYENYHAGIQQWYRTHTSRVGGSESRVVANLFEDITDRKRREANIAFLNEIGKDLSVLSAPDEIIQTVGTRLGEFLQISGCIFADVDEAKNEATIHHGWNTADVSSLKQTFRLADYFGEEFARAGRAGETVIVRNTARDERANAEAYARLKIGSFVTVPFQQHGRWVANITVTSREPRDWRSDEIELLQEIASRVFPRIERARAESALRESEAKYRSLFNTIDEGLAITEMIYDDEGEICDIIYRQVNRAYERHGGVYDVVGRSIFDVIPGVEDYWLDLYKRVAKTGESVREENHQQDVDRWFDVYFSRVDDNGRFVAIVFSDITDRKRAEQMLRESEARQAFLLRLGDALRPLTNAVQIQETAMRLLAEELDVMRATYIEVEDDQDRYELTARYEKDAPPIPNRGRISDFSAVQAADYRSGRTLILCETETEAQPEAYRAIGVRAAVAVPLVKDGQLVAIVGVHSKWPRNWTTADVQLLEELAERTWAAVERARAETALRESEEKYRSLFNSIDEGYFLCDVIFDENDQPVDLFYIDENPAAIRMTGQSFRGQRLREINPNYEEYWYEIFGRVAQTGQAERLERYAEPDQIWYDFYVFKVGSDDTRQVAVVFNDISDRKRQEEALRESEERLRDVLNSMAEGFALLGGDFTILDVNEETLRLDGRSRDELIGRTHWDAFPGTEDSPVGEIFRRVARERRPASLEHVYRWPDGRSLWLDMRVYPTQNAGVAIFWRDVTDRKQAEAALRESEERLQKAISIETVGVLFFKLDGRITDANDTFLRMSGYSRDELRAITDWQDLTPPEFWDVTSCAALELATLGKTAPYEKQHIRKDGSRWWGLFSPTRLKGSGRNSECVEFVIDISDRKRAEEQLRRVAEIDAFRVKLSDALRSLSDPEEIKYQAACVLGKHLGSDRAYYVEIEEARSEFVVARDWHQPGAPSHARRYPLEGWPMPWLVDGQPWVVRDVDTDPAMPDDQRTSYRGNDIGALIVVPLIKNGHLVATLATNQHTPRDWTPDEITVVQETAERTWAAVERAYAEAALRESEEKYRSLFESINDGFALLEVMYDGSDRPINCRFLEVSPSFETQTGLPQAQGKTLRELIPSVESGWFEHYHQALVTNALVHFEMHQNYLNTWFEVDVLPYGNPQDRQVTIVFRNINERKQAEAERLQLIREQSAREQERQRAEALAELDRAKTLFFSNVSHEFRTPLTLSLAPLSDALSDSANPLPPAQKERLELVHRNSLRLLKLVNTLLDFSRIEAGRIEAVYEPTDLALFTTELTSVFRSAIERAGLRLVVDCPPISEPVYVDRQMWEKIVLNLLSNAFKFTLEGKIAVRLHLADDYHVRLQVEDTGTGIEPEELPHLFERFYQVRGAKARTHEGSGIGLALVHELIKMHGGTVDVSSTVGVGSCFTVTIPLGTAHLPSERIEATRTLTSTALGTASYVHEAERWLPEEENRVGGTGNREESCLSPVTCHLSPFSAHVLIVDDNADMRDYLKRILSEHVEVQAVADGAAALAIVIERVPDLVLSDVMMPQMDGFELIKALRADARTKEVPIILLSARAGEESVIEGLQAGADDYLIKPFSATELVTRVNVHLQMAHLRSEALRQERTMSRRKDEVLATVSHELNTPLVAILGWTRLLRSSPLNQSMLMKALETIERNATVQAKLIQDLLDISRITAGKISLNYQSVDLKSIIDTAIATVRQSLETKDICLEYIVDPLSITVEGDPERLQQIVLNLLTNAIKFTPQGGRIKVRLDITENQAQIVVKDNGKGISAEFLPHVFDIFRQSESSHSKNGLGLGLAIARHLVELHGGKIYAESPGVGRGATFTVKLPLVGVSL